MILIISSPQDVHAQAVSAALTRRGAAWRLLDLSAFPMSMEIGLSFAGGGETGALRFPDGARLDMGAVAAVWWRRPQPVGLPQGMTDPVHRAFATQECDLALRGLWQCSRAFWINDVARDAAASSKPWQLHLAREVGLAVPNTLITNSPADAERFRREAGGPVIYKAFLASAYAWRETRILRDSDAALLSAVRVAPVIFQRYVEATHDLRVTVVDREVFAAAAETARGEYPADIRMNPRTRWTRWTLPDPVRERLLALMDRAGIVYGAADFRVTPEGEHVFLEVNPAGQFLFVEKAAGLPIAEAMAERLARGATSDAERPAARAAGA